MDGREANAPQFVKHSISATSEGGAGRAFNDSSACGPGMGSGVCPGNSQTTSLGAGYSNMCQNYMAGNGPLTGIVVHHMAMD